MNSFPDWVFSLQKRTIEAGLRNDSVETILKKFCDSIYQNGIPIERVVLGYFIVHPLHLARDYVWIQGDKKIQTIEYGRVEVTQESFRNTPFFYMTTQGVPALRCQLKKSDAEFQFPIYKKLKAQGYTDYFGFCHTFGTKGLTINPTNVRTERVKEGLFGSFCTSAKQGFSESDIHLLKNLHPFFASAVKSKSLIDLAKDVGATYIGTRTSQRVLSGEIDRGSIDTIQAVIWYGDLKGFTKMSDTIPSERLIPCLNDYLEVVSRPVIERGGEILKYMGDGVLAIFEINNNSRAQVLRTLEAAETAFRDLHRMNKKRKLANDLFFEFDLVLHVGEVAYGNIGAIDRLDFTVIGPAVNEASRMESLCDTLDQRLILSKAFKDLVPSKSKPLQSLGTHELRGIHGAKELFTLELSS